MLTATLRFLTANGSRHSRSKMMWLLRWSTTATITWLSVLLTMTRQLLLEAHHIWHMIIVHVLGGGSQCLALAAHSALVVLRYGSRRGPVYPSSAADASTAVIIRASRSGSTRQLLTCCQHLFLTAVVMHHLLGLARRWYAVGRTTLPAAATAALVLLLLTSIIYES